MKKQNNVFQTIFIAAGICAGLIAGIAGFSHASQDGAKKHDRKGLPMEMIITADELRQKQLQKTNLLILDARGVTSYEESHLQDAVLPMTADYYRQETLVKKGLSRQEPDADKALRENLSRYPKDTPIVTYCSSGGCQASGVLALQIKRLGFQDVKAMEDGIQTWAKKGYPVASGGQK